MSYKHKISVADKPLALGGVEKPLSISEFEKKFNCCYTENLSFAPEFRGLLTHYTPPPLDLFYDEKDLLTKLKIRLRAPNPKIVICHMGNKAGYGAFAREDIAQGEVLCAVGGEILAFNAEDINANNHYLVKYPDGNFCLSQLRLSGIARFFQHLPLDHERRKVKLLQYLGDNENLIKFAAKERPNQLETLNRSFKTRSPAFFDTLRQIAVEESIALDIGKDNELANIEFCDEETKRSLATSNVEMVFVKLNRIPYILFVASYDIKKHEIMGMRYSLKHGQLDGGFPELFTRTGVCIDRKAYRRQKAVLSFVLRGDTNVEGRVAVTKEQLDTYIHDHKTKPFPLTVKDHGLRPISIFTVRDRAVDAVMVPRHYGRLADTPLVTRLKQKFPDTDVAPYYRNPSHKDEDTDIVDVVVTAPSRERHSQLTHFFTSVTERLVINPDTAECIVKGPEVDALVKLQW